MGDWRIVTGVAAVTGIAIGLGLGSMLGEDSHEGSPARISVTSSKGPAAADPEWAALRGELAREREARMLLAEEIELLWEEVELIAQSAEPAAPIAQPPIPDTTAVAPPAPKPKFDDARLVEFGVVGEEIELIREHYEAKELDELYLRDQAVREGWLHGNRFRTGVRELERQLREDLGDEDYDRMLFATGQINQVRVKDVFGQSPAADAGLLAGDIILRYAEQRVFNPRALRTWTTRGAFGENVLIDIFRNGEIISVSIVRGPLGVQIKGESLPPKW